MAELKFYDDRWKINDSRIHEILTSTMSEGLMSNFITQSKPEDVWMYNTVQAILNKGEKTMNKPTITENKPTITDYNYYPLEKTTVLTWSDGTKTTAKNSNTDGDTENDLFVGFMICIAKKFMHNATSVAEEWIVKKPKRKAAAEAKAKKEKEDRKKAKRRAELRKKAEMINAAYAAEEAEKSMNKKIKRIAMEKYNIPEDFVDKYLDDCGWF